MTPRIKKESLKGTSVNKIILYQCSPVQLLFSLNTSRNLESEAEFDSHLYILLILYREAFWKIVQLNSVMRHENALKYRLILRGIIDTAGSLTRCKYP